MNDPTPTVRGIFEQALDVADVAQRQAFVAQACAGNEELRRRVERLLQAHARADHFLGASGAPPSADPAIGSMVGHYTLLAVIGEGGFGIVYRAAQTEPVARQVALKIIKPGLDTRAVVARFEAERQALALMDHPNIAHILDGGTTDNGRPFFVMELVEGVPLNEYCDQHQLTTQQRLAMFLDVCAAAQHAHQKGIIHRDLKPSNILVAVQSGRPVPKVIDFGVVKALGQKLTDKTLMTLEHQFLGTPVYCSPEQVDPTATDVDTRADIYSLGVILYELLTGKTPFEPEALRQAAWDEVVRILREKDPPRPSTRLTTMGKIDLDTVARLRGAEPAKLPNQLRGDLDWIVMKSLEKDRNRRYASASTLALDLQRHLNHEPVEAAAPSVAYRTGKFIRRHRLGVAAGCAIAIALMLGAGISLWQAERATRHAREFLHQRNLADQERQRAERRELQARQIAYVSDMNLAHQALNGNYLGDARRLLNRHRPQPAERDFRHWEWRYLWQLSRGDETFALPPHSNRINALGFSPDGTLLAAADRDGTLKLWEVAARRERATFALGGAHYCVAFSPQGRWLAVGGKDDTDQAMVFLYDVAEGRQIAKLPHPTKWLVRSCVFSPDSTHLVTFHLANSVRVWDLATLEWELLPTPPPPRVLLYGGVVRFSPEGRYLAIGNMNGSIQLLDAQTWREQRSIQAHAGSISALAFSPDGRHLASADCYGISVIKIWSVETGQELVQLPGHNGWVSSLAFLPDGRRLISAASDQTVRIWEWETRTNALVLRGHLDEVLSLDIAPGGDRFATGCKNGDILFWEANPRAKWLSAITFSARPESSLAFAPDGRKLAYLTKEGTAALRDCRTLQVTAEWLALGTNNLCLTFNPASSRLLVGDAAGAIKLVDPNSGALLIQQVLTTNPIVSLVYYDRGQKVIVATRRDITVWKTNPWVPQCAWPITTPFQSANSVSPDDKLLAMANDNQTVVLYDLLTGQPHRILRGYKERVRGAVFHPHGQFLLTGSEDGSLELWDYERVTHQDITDTLGQAIHSVNFSPDGLRVIAGGNYDPVVRLWDLATMQEVLRLPGAGQLSRSVTFSPDGNVIVAVSGLGSLCHLWRAPSFEEIEATASNSVPKP